MMKSHDDLVGALKASGMAVDAFTLTYEGRFAEADAEWNYKDVLHLFHMHPGVVPVLGIIEHDKAIYINLQRVFGLRLPICMISYHPQALPETYFTTCFFYTLVVSISYAEREPEASRIETRYSVCAPRLLAWTLPIIRWLIKRNYRWLMEGDIPMRNRRAELRKRGYEFRRNGDRYSFLESLNPAQSNVIPPAGATPFATVEVNLETDLPPGGEVLLGDDGHLGLRLVRLGDRIMAFPRMCDHEGASLDGRACENRRIKCPWHGRLVTPLAELNAAPPGPGERKAGAYLLRRKGAVLRVEPYAGLAVAGNV